MLKTSASESKNGAFVMTSSFGAKANILLEVFLSANVSKFLTISQASDKTWKMDDTYEGILL